MKKRIFLSLFSVILSITSCIPVITTVKEHSQYQDYKNTKKEVFNALYKILKKDSFEITRQNYINGVIDAQKGTVMNSKVVSEGVDTGVAFVSILGLYAKVGDIRIQARTIFKGNGITRLSVRAISGDAEFNRKITDLILKKVQLDLM